jgi:hypothetical protein
MNLRAWVVRDRQFVIAIATFWVAMMATLFWTLVSIPSLPSPSTSAGPGWTDVGNGTRLQYVDVDGVRCFRRYYSDQLSCVRLAP